MSILVTGASGLLGLTFCLEASKRYGTVYGVAHTQSLDAAPFTVLRRDLLSGNSARDLIEEAQPDYVVHCAALTSVDRCEENTELAFQEREPIVWTAAQHLRTHIVSVLEFRPTRIGSQCAVVQRNHPRRAVEKLLQPGSPRLGQTGDEQQMRGARDMTTLDQVIGDNVILQVVPASWASEIQSASQQRSKAPPCVLKPHRRRVAPVIRLRNGLVGPETEFRARRRRESTVLAQVM